jgi:hypothetical protein
MWGSPWHTLFTYDSSAGRVIRHCCPSAAVADENFVAKRTVLIKLQYQGSKPSYVAVNRNNYSSLSYGTFNGQQAVDFIYYDATLGKVMRWNPYVDTVPKDFDGILV